MESPVNIRTIPVRLAWCLRCRTLFEWISGVYRSTRGEDTYPRCPICGSYKKTVDKAFVKRVAGCYPSWKDLNIR